MKDKQIPSSSAEPRIPLVSAALHCVSMTALVYLRHSFGFGFLRPRSVFFAFSWAFTLFAIYAWLEAGVWNERRALLIFGCGAMLLFWVHQFIAFRRELTETGEHEHYSGTSFLVKLQRRSRETTLTRNQTMIRVWGEPGAVLLASGMLRVVFSEHHLSTWLFWTASALWAKESLNYWFRIRQKKRQEDIFSDTADTVEPPTTSNLAPEPPKATRKGKIRRSRAAPNDADSTALHHWAELLHLVPPYTIEQAEAKYRDLIKIEHPDTNENSEESNARAAELNEAVEYFRQTLQ